MRWRTIALLFGVLLVAGCFGDASQPAVHEPALELVRDVPTTPEGVDEPLVYQPRALTPIGDGLLAVLDAGDPRIVVVDPGSGHAVRRFGRTGGGPGEIKGASAMLWEGLDGSLLIADPLNRRLMRYSLSGELLDERPLQTDAGIGSSMGVPGTDRLYVQDFTIDEASLAQAHNVSLVDVTTGDLRRVLALPEPPRMTQGLPGQVRFFPRPLWTVLPDGRVVTGRTDSAVFTVYDPDGSPVARLELPYSPRPVSDLDRRAIIEKWRRATGSDRAPGIYDLYPVSVRMMPINDSVFAIQHMGDNYPAELDPPADGQVVWTLISTAGEILGVVAFPVEFAPYWSWENRILGVGRDENGVARLQEWRLDL